jgi:hypothetical protein
MAGVANREPNAVKTVKLKDASDCGFASKVSKCPFSFTPGFSPVIKEQKSEGTVLTVYCFPEPSEALLS